MDIWKRGIGSRRKLQAAIDFLTAYGISFLAIGIALAVLYKVGINQYNTPNVCTPNPGFSCTYFRLNYTGILNLTLAQATGLTLNIQGIACSSSVNQYADEPGYGNYYVTNSASYYPFGGAAFPQTVFYTGTTISIPVYCYNGGDGGSIATGTLGNTYTGYVWLNYTTTPSTGNHLQTIATFTTKYT